MIGKHIPLVEEMLTGKKMEEMSEAAEMQKQGEAKEQEAVQEAEEKLCITNLKHDWEIYEASACFLFSSFTARIHRFKDN